MEYNNNPYGPVNTNYQDLPPPPQPNGIWRANAQVGQQTLPFRQVRNPAEGDHFEDATNWLASRGYYGNRGGRRKGKSRRGGRTRKHKAGTHKRRGGRKTRK